MSNPGMLYQIKSGVYAGKYCTAYVKKQTAHYLNQNKLLVRLYHDIECEQPMDDTNEHTTLLIDASKLNHIGYFD